MKNFYGYLDTISSEKKKKFGITYTPLAIVEYINTTVLKTWREDRPPRVLDPCCGTGVFLHDIAKKISDRWGIPLPEVLKDYIYGFEIDAAAAKVCETNLPGATIRVCDSLKEEYDFCDIIVTNPPYVRIQNLPDEQALYLQENFSFCKGDTDLYIAFLEKFASSKKVVGLICANSWIRNKSTKLLRNSLYNNNAILRLVDLKDTQVFEGVQTYPSIMILTPQKNLILEYSQNMRAPLREIAYKDSSSERLFLGLDAPAPGSTSILDICDIKVGLATLCDGVYFGEVLENKGKLCLFKNKYDTFLIETAILKKCIKASKISNVKLNTYVIFPYDQENKLLTENFIKKTYPKAYDYLTEKKEKLLDRDRGKMPKDKWYGFGRTQGLNNNFEKFLIPPFQKERLQLRHSLKNEYYISGYAAIPKNGYNLETVRQCLESDKLFSWIEDTGKTMRGGWVGLSKEVFKNYKFNLKEII